MRDEMSDPPRCPVTVEIQCVHVGGHPGDHKFRPTPTEDRGGDANAGGDSEPAYARDENSDVSEGRGSVEESGTRGDSSGGQSGEIPTLNASKGEVGAAVNQHGMEPVASADSPAHAAAAASRAHLARSHLVQTGGGHPEEHQPDHPDSEVPAHLLSEGWPGGISDGLTLPCGVCGVVPSFDYTVTEESWKTYAPHEHRLGVVCLPCLDRLASETSGTLKVLRIQFCGIGKTIVFMPTMIHRYRAVDLPSEDDHRLSAPARFERGDDPLDVWRRFSTHAGSDMWKNIADHLAAEIARLRTPAAREQPSDTYCSACNALLRGDGTCPQCGGEQPKPLGWITLVSYEEVPGKIRTEILTRGQLHSTRADAQEEADETEAKYVGNTYTIEPVGPPSEEELGWGGGSIGIDVLPHEPVGEQPEPLGWVIAAWHWWHGREVPCIKDNLYSQKKTAEMSASWFREYHPGPRYTVEPVGSSTSVEEKRE